MNVTKQQVIFIDISSRSCTDAVMKIIAKCKPWRITMPRWATCSRIGVSTVFSFATFGNELVATFRKYSTYFTAKKRKNPSSITHNTLAHTFASVAQYWRNDGINLILFMSIKPSFACHSKETVSDVREYGWDYFFTFKLFKNPTSVYHSWYYVKQYLWKSANINFL